MYFLEYGLQKTWLGKCLKRPLSEDPWKRNMVNGPKHCWNLHSSNRKLIWKKLLLLICKTLGLPCNTLTADDKYSFLNRENLTQAIQKHLSKKQKTFCVFLSEFLKSIWNFEYFERKYDSHSLCISKRTYCERRWIESLYFMLTKNTCSISRSCYKVYV